MNGHINTGAELPHDVSNHVDTRLNTPEAAGNTPEHVTHWRDHMTKRQQQHQGRSEGDETTLEGRDIKAGAVAGTGNKRATGASEDGLESSNDALHIGKLLEEAKRHGPGKSPEG